MAFSETDGIPFFTAHIRNSVFPSPPAIGDFMIPYGARLFSIAHEITRWIAAICCFLSLTSPPRPIASRPHSNCGLMRAIYTAPSLRMAETAGITRVWEIKERSLTAQSQKQPSYSTVRYRALHPSKLVTRVSARSLGSS